MDQIIDVIHNSKECSIQEKAIEQEQEINQLE